MPGGSTGTVVLIVDDEPAIRLLCRVNLELDGYGVREADSAAAAREAIAAGGVDVVLLDMQLGMHQADDLLAELVGRTPVAAMTGSADLRSERFSGADGLLPKPFTLVELRTVVADLAAR